MSDCNIGDTVIIRTFGNRPKIRKIWDYNDLAVFVCLEAQYMEYRAGNLQPKEIGFPISDVYIYEEGVSEGDNIDWARLKPYFSRWAIG